MEIDKNFLNMPRFAAAFFGAFLFSLSLLFLQEMQDIQRIYMIPAILVYTQGAAILGMINRMLGYNYEPVHNNTETGIPIHFRLIIWIAHIVWFAALVGYLYYRGVL